MNEFLLPWLMLCVVNLVATMSPGPAFAMTVKNSIAYDRKAGILTAIGLGLAVGVHVALLAAGISILLVHMPMLFLAIKYSGALYLIFIGIKALRAKPHNPESKTTTKNKKDAIPGSMSFLTQGFITNLLNPKGFVFFVTVYVQFIDLHTPAIILILYGITTMIIETAWFSGLAMVLTHTAIKARFLNISHWIERICGGLLITLGVKLLLDKGLKAAS